MEAKLIIKDEVNVKIEGLELKDRKVLSDKFKLEVPGVRYTPAVRLGRWDGKVSFFQLSGSTYINLLPDIIPYLQERGYDIDLEDIRTYQTKFDFQEIKENTFSHFNWPEGHTHAGNPIMLRDYQVKLVNDFLSNPQCIQEAATGAGKTIITAALSWSCEPYGRTIVIVPNKSLVQQTEKDYRCIGLDVGVYFGDRKEYNHKHTICTWQSLNNMLKDTKAGKNGVDIGDFIDGVVCVIVDEVHLAKAEALKSLLTGVFSHIPIRWGLTGTIPKEAYDQIAIICSIGQVIGKLTANELQERGVLANCHVNIVQLRDYVEYKDYASELNYLTSEPGRLTWLANLIKQIKESGNTLILVNRIDTGKSLAAQIPDSVFISGRMKVNDRQEEYDDIAVSNNSVIIATYGVASTGINIPRIFNLILFEPGKSFTRVIQSIGRGIRKAKDKDFVQIWDITSTCKFSKRHLTKRKQFYNEAKYPYTVEKAEWK